MTRRGLTLLELLVALTITGLVMTAGYAALSSLVDRRAAAAFVSDEISRAAAVRRTLRAWLSGTELTIEDDGVYFRGYSGLSADAADDELSFRTTSRTPVGESGATVRLFIDRNDSTPERGLVARFTNRRGEATQTLELAPAARSLDVRYLSSVAQPQIWEDSWVSATLLPAAVELTVGATASDSLGPLLRLPLLVPIGSAR